MPPRKPRASPQGAARNAKDEADVAAAIAALEAWPITEAGAAFVVWVHRELTPRVAALLEQHGVEPDRARDISEEMSGTFAGVVGAAACLTPRRLRKLH